MTEEKDWIKEFADKYSYNLENHVFPVVKNFEIERKILFVIATVTIIITTIAAFWLVYLILSRGRSVQPYYFKLPLFIFGLGISFWKFLQHHFEYKIKTKIMPKLINAFEDFSWLDVPPDSYSQDIQASDIFPFYKNKSLTHSYSDFFLGKYKSVKLEFSKAEYNNDKYDFYGKFLGGMIRIKMNKNFTGITVLRPKKVHCKDLEALGMKKTILEDLEFNKKFNVYSTDQIEARYLLTTAFMERLKNISMHFSETGRIYCSFCNDYIYIAPETKGRMFALFGLTKRADDIEIFHKFFGQIVSVLDLVQYLKLNIRTGL